MNRHLYGLRAWVWQRLSALLLALGFILFLFHMMFDAPGSYEEWRAWVADPSVSIVTGLFFIALLMHAWIGMRDVILDYIHPVAIRFSVLSLLGLFLVACALWILRALLMVAI